MAVAEETVAMMQRLAKELEELAAVHKGNARMWKRRLLDQPWATTTTAPTADLAVTAEAVQDVSDPLAAIARPIHHQQR